jgi:hypothetical protein
MSADLGPFRFFWAGKVMKPCPDCGNKTSVGFDQNDPGAADRELSRFTGCVADLIKNEVQFSRATPIPLPELGSCVTCYGPARVYGPQGNPACDGCRTEPETRQGPGMRIPAPRLPEVSPEPEHEPEFSLF